jgi:GH25 family lysozyme M1 (1,4-beta-N-acetylmuramidase)
VIRGIDVSSHQPRVDWARVKADGIGFVYIKATEGVGFVDPKFGAHWAGAKSVGLPRGAYHFARPDTGSGGTAATAKKDANAEADAFLATAAPRSGDLLPVLDLETAGLSPSLMVVWATAWLERVRARTGVRPVLYTYPGFWSRMGNTRTLGSYPLWIASYGVSSPQVPAGWSRYTIWQYTSSGSVPGIAGNVDMNQLAARLSLASITYKPATTPPAPRPGAHNYPGPVPKPGWFWPWLRWRMGVAEFEGLGQNMAVRPDEAPTTIPQWAWASLKKLEDARGRAPSGSA